MYPIYQRKFALFIKFKCNNRALVVQGSEKKIPNNLETLPKRLRNHPDLITSNLNQTLQCLVRDVARSDECAVHPKDVVLLLSSFNGCFGFLKIHCSNKVFRNILLYNCVIMNKSYLFIQFDLPRQASQWWYQ